MRITRVLQLCLVLLFSAGFSFSVSARSVYQHGCDYGGKHFDDSIFEQQISSHNKLSLYLYQRIDFEPDLFAQREAKSSEEGYRSPEEEEYQRGYRKGYDDGYKEGYSKGHNEGYKKGRGEKEEIGFFKGCLTGTGGCIGLFLLALLLAAD